MTDNPLIYYRVDYIESEAGWGQSVDGSSYFRDRQKAIEKINEFNSHNTAKTTPAWYMRADGPFTVEIGEELAKMISSDMVLRDIRSR